MMWRKSVSPRTKRRTKEISQAGLSVEISLDKTFFGSTDFLCFVQISVPEQGAWAYAVLRPLRLRPYSDLNFKCQMMFKTRSKQFESSQDSVMERAYVSPPSLS